MGDLLMSVQSLTSGVCFLDVDVVRGGAVVGVRQVQLHEIEAEVMTSWTDNLSINC